MVFILRFNDGLLAWSLLLCPLKSKKKAMMSRTLAGGGFCASNSLPLRRIKVGQNLASQLPQFPLTMSGPLHKCDAAGFLFVFFLASPAEMDVRELPADDLECVWQSCLGVHHRMGDWSFCLVILQINRWLSCVVLMGIASCQRVMVCLAAHGDWGNIAGSVSKGKLSSTSGWSHRLISSFTSWNIILIYWRYLSFIVLRWVKLNRPTAGQAFSSTDVTICIIFCFFHSSNTRSQAQALDTGIFMTLNCFFPAVYVMPLGSRVTGRTRIAKKLWVLYSSYTSPSESFKHSGASIYICIFHNNEPSNGIKILKELPLISHLVLVWTVLWLGLSWTNEPGNSCTQCSVCFLYTFPVEGMRLNKMGNPGWLLEVSSGPVEDSRLTTKNPFTLFGCSPACLQHLRRSFSLTILLGGS